MSINIGNYNPEFSFQINIENSFLNIYYTGNINIVTGHVIDSNQITTTTQYPISGYNYIFKLIPNSFFHTGFYSTPTLKTNYTGIASIIQSGLSGSITVLNSGNFDLVLNYPSNSIYSNQNATSLIQNNPYVINPTINIQYIPDNIIPSQHVLIVYNTNSTNSINLLNYYTGTRPQFGTANILGISCTSGTATSYFNYTGSIQKPVINYLTGVSGSKPIRYLIMMKDVPNQVVDTVTYSVPYQLFTAYSNLGLRTGISYQTKNNHFSLGQYQGNTILTSYIDANSYNDCVQYINKISTNQTGLYLTGYSQSNKYYFDDASGYAMYTTFLSGRYLQPLIQNNTGLNYIYSTNTQSHITTGNNLLGYATWGVNGGLTDSYANDGSIKWSGNNWYVMTTIESFNGNGNTGNPSQGNYYKWLESGAFGGHAYENCPIAMTTTNNEPFVGGQADSGLFVLWQSGFPFIECAWQSYVSVYTLPIGDPFIVK